MKWLITKDHISETLGPDFPSRAGHGTYFDKGERRNEYYIENHLPQISKELPTRFKLYDDDGLLHFEGRCENIAEQDSDSAFEPLDWGMNDTGCTTMKVATGVEPFEVL